MQAGLVLLAREDKLSSREPRAYLARKLVVGRVDDGVADRAVLNALEVAVDV